MLIYLAHPFTINFLLCIFKLMSGLMDELGDRILSLACDTASKESFYAI